MPSKVSAANTKTQCRETQPCYDREEAERCKIVTKSIKNNPKWIVDQGRGNHPHQHHTPVSKGLQILRTPTAHLPSQYQHERPDPKNQRSRGRVHIAPRDGPSTSKIFDCIIFLSVTITSGLVIIKLKISIVLTINSWLYVQLCYIFAHKNYKRINLVLMEKYVETISSYFIRFRISMYAPVYGECCMNFISFEKI